jgi:predicted site-specific integrase-resolvase
MNAAPEVGAERWISLRAASNRLGIPVHTMRRLVRRGIVKTRRLPGTRPVVSEADVDRLDRDSTRVPTDS